MLIQKLFSGNNKLQIFALTLGLLTCWIVTHPYNGIFHDARLYTVQALSHLYPKAYLNDIFIRYGVQDSWTIFSPLYAYVIRLFGLNNAAILLLLIGHTLWMTAAFYIARTLLTEKTFWLFLVLLFTLPRYYGSGNVFSYGEPFLTPRIFAEALTLYSIAFFIQKKHFLSIFSLCVAIFFHPLIAGGGLVFLLIYSRAYKTKSSIFVLLTAVIMVVSMAVSGIEPAVSLFRIMDDRWYKLVELRNPYVLVSTWSAKDLNTVLFNCSIILTALMIVADHQRQVLSSALITGISGLIFSWLGADVLHNVFVIQVQIWRVLWLMQWFTYLAVALVIAELKNISDTSRFLCAFYLIAWFGLDLFGGALALIVLILFYFNHKSEKELMVPYSIKITAYIVLIVTASLWFLDTKTAIGISYLLNENLPDFSIFDCIFFTNVAPFFIIVFGLIWKASTRFNKASVFVVAAVFLFVVSNWDLRTAWEKKRENKNFVYSQPFAGKIPPESVVYWQDSIQETWLTLGRSSYASSLQGAPLIFSRELALTLEKRLKRLEALGVRDNISFRDEKKDQHKIQRQPTTVGMIHVAYDPDVDFVVLDQKLPVGLIDEYHDNEKERSFYLYDCNFIRENFQDLWLEQLN